MPESLQKILAEAKSGKLSSINGLSEDDVANVWENVAAYIEKQMSNQKGVLIPNFGTFSFSQKKLDVGNNRFVLMQRPVFNISEKFAQTLGLQFTKYVVPGHIPSPTLNYAALAFESPFDRDTVESCVREIVGSVSRAIAAGRNVELAFAGIGRLQIRESRVKMRFYKEFINQMDGSGDLMNSMQNRAGTVDSVMSNRPFSRPGTTNTLVLPRGRQIIVTYTTGVDDRINPGTNAGPNALPPLAETDENQNYSDPPVPSTPPEPIVDMSIDPQIVQHVDDRPDEPEGLVLQEEMEPHICSEAIRVDAFAKPGVGDIATETAFDNLLREAEARDEPADVYVPKQVMEDIHVERKGSPANRGMSRMAMSLAKASGVSLMDDLPVPPADTKGVAFADMVPGSGREHKPLTPPRLAPLQRSISAENMIGEKPASKPPTPASACGHPQAGQELCYLCHQRARRNIPVSFTEERRKREEEEERLLQQYQTMRDAEDILREQERHISRRHDLQKISAFNLGVSEAVNAKKKAKDTTEPQRSYIFQRRPLTPPRLPKQEQYLRDLTRQVEAKDSAAARKKADDQFLERLEQVQLAEDLAAQREQNIKDKVESVDTYKKALDAQMKYKPIPLPPREPDSEIFGKNDTTNEKLMERRRRANLMFQEQKELVDQRKRDTILKRLMEQERDQLILEKTKEGINEDRALRHKARFDGRRRLEEDWKQAAEMKRAQDLDDRLLGLESGQLLHEQCDQYNRCKQCKRRVNNCGESNIWSESRYVPGSRIMV